MKKLVVLFLLCTGLSAQGIGLGHLYLKVSGDVSSDYKSDADDDTGLGVGLEYLLSLPLTGLELGAGIMFNDDGDAIAAESVEEKDLGDYELFEAETYGSVPVYLTAKYNLPGLLVRPYLKGNLGYSYTLGTKSVTVKNAEEYLGNPKDAVDVEDSFYYGVGVGVQFPIVNVELMYQVATYDKVSLLFGVRF